MPRQAHITVSPEHAARAKTIASHLGIPVGFMVSTWIDLYFQNEFGEAPRTVMPSGNDLLIEIGDDPVVIPQTSAANYADALDRIADKGGRFLDLEHPQLLSIGRRGKAVTIETNEGRKLRHTIGEAVARQIATELRAYLK